MRYRIYPDHPKRFGTLACSRCGSDMDEKNALSLCKVCVRALNIQAERLKGRNYGEIVCICGTTCTKKSPTQLFHSKECEKRVMRPWAEQKRDTKFPARYVPVQSMVYMSLVSSEIIPEWSCLHFNGVGPR